MTRRTVLAAFFLFSCTGAPKKTTPPPGPEPPVQLTVQAAISTPKGLQAIPEGAVLHSGDMMVFHVQASKDVMLFVVQESSGHKLSMQIPSGKQPTVLAKANEDTRLPQEGSWLRPEEQPGEQALYVIASSLPIEESLVLSLVNRREVTREREPPPVIVDKQRGGQATPEVVPRQQGTLGPDHIAIIPFRYYSE